MSVNKVTHEPREESVALPPAFKILPEPRARVTRTRSNAIPFRDTETLYSEVFQQILDPYGKKYTWEVKSKLMGTHAEESARFMVAEYDLPMTWEEFSVLAKKKTSEIMANAQLLPGAERLIKHLHENKVPFCLATSSSQEMTEIKTSNHKELFDLFHHKVMGATDPEVKIGKPAPDIFLVAASRFPDKPKPSDCLVFEDAPNGVKSAAAADMQSVMVPDKRAAPELRQEATIVLDTLVDFKPEIFGLPPFTD